MKVTTIFKIAAVVVAVTALATACSSDDDNNNAAAGSAGSSSGSASADFVALGGWNDGECNSSQPKVSVAITQPLEVAGTSLKDYVDGTQASVDAFNGRGGIKGRCLDLNVCDGKGDGPTELSCARQETDDPNVVAGLTSTFTVSEGDAYQLFESAGLAQVGAQVTQPGAWNSPVSFDFTMGGSGTLLAGMPALKNVGVTKFVVMIPESPQSGALKAFAAPLISALGMEMIEIIGIPPTAVEFTQFVLTAQNSGAQGIVLGLPGNTAGQIIDAMDSLNSQLKVAVSWGTFSQSAVESLPEEIANNTAYSDAVPPVATNLTRWPIYNVVLDDFKESGKPALTSENVTAQSINGWLGVYALIKVMRDSGATDITRASVKQAFDQAQNVPVFNLMPPWTPSKQSANAIFKGISNPNYWTGTWDADNTQFTVADKQVDILALLG
jgi:ABC-type branched-subunit amino acid transport system substrate-binding protein